MGGVEEEREQAQAIMEPLSQRGGSEPARHAAERPADEARVATPQRLGRGRAKRRLDPGASGEPTSGLLQREHQRPGNRASIGQSSAVVTLAELKVRAR